MLTMMSEIWTLVHSWQVIVGVVAVIAVLSWIRSCLQQRAAAEKYRAAVAQKTRVVSAALEQAKLAGLGWDGFTTWSATQTGSPTAQKVLSQSATALCASLAKGEFSAEYLMRLFIARAILVNKEINAVTEQRYEAALKEAQECDADRKAGKSRGPLHGLPVSIKEQIGQKGFDATCGACVRLFQPRTEDAVLVTLLREAGAIPFARTNVPQLLMLPESFNAIYGTTKNPFNLDRTAGGSSGGEAALIAARGSPLGIGTDVGGSIRIPAAFTGTCGLKPTNDRLSVAGFAVARKGDASGQKEIRGSAGPMAHCVDDLETTMQVLCTQRQYELDGTIPPVPWDRAAYEAAAATPRLRFGYYEADGWAAPAPACARAVREAVEALKAAGHEVVPFEPVELPENMRLYVSLMASDGNLDGFMTAIEGEPLHPAYKFLSIVANIPGAIRPMIAFVLRSCVGQSRTADLMAAGGGKSTRDYWQVIVARDKLKKQFLARFAEAGLDAILCPGMGFPAFKHETSNKLMQLCSYTSVYNNFNLPCGAVPVSVVRADEQTYQDPANPDTITAAAVETSAGTEGLPVGVQIVCQPWKEERCLGVMKVLEGALAAAGKTAPIPEMAIPR